MMLDEWEDWIQHLLSGADTVLVESQCLIPTPETPEVSLEALESVEEDFLSCSR